MIKLMILNHGCVYLPISELRTDISSVPTGWREKQQQRDKVKWHITVISSKDKPKDKKIDEMHDISYFELGLAIKKDIAYIVCFSPDLQAYRKQLGYDGDAQFHITVGFQGTDNHDIDKSFTTITQPNLAELESLVKSKCVHRCSEKLLSMIEHYLPRNYDVKKALINYYWNAKLTGMVNFYLIWFIEEGYVKDFIRINTILDNPCDLILDALGHVSIADSDDRKKLLDLLNRKKTHEDKHEYLYDPDTSTPNMYTRPGNFSAIDDEHHMLYGSAIVNSKHTDYLRAKEISVIINLMETSESSISQNPLFTYYHYPINDREATDQAYMEQILKVIHNHIKQGDQVLVHCLGGRGRTVMVGIAYMIRYLDYELYSLVNKLSSTRNVTLSSEQFELLRKQIPDKGVNVRLNNEAAPAMIIMCGLPGSGKSTLSKHIVQYCPNFARINQDEMGKKECYNQVGKLLAEKRTVIVDRCNLTPDDRKEWLNYIGYGKKAWCFHMSTPLEECKYRVTHRKNHETLSGKNALKIVESSALTFNKPSISEGYSKLIDMKDENSVNFYLESWKLPVIEDNATVNVEVNVKGDHYVKFPRTRHLHNLGGVSRDDLLLTQKEQTMYLNRNIIVEEKIDGANLGFSMDSNYKILVQNRSHYVNSSYHPQFKKLDKWINQHYTDLQELLEPNKNILFGEWMYARHSIHYHNLPDMFLAFDLYDKNSATFLSRNKLESKLKQTLIKQVPLIYEG